MSLGFLPVQALLGIVATYTGFRRSYSSIDTSRSAQEIIIGGTEKRLANNSIGRKRGLELGGGQKNLFKDGAFLLTFSTEIFEFRILA